MTRPELDDAVALWQERVGYYAHGRLGKALNPVVKQHGYAKTREAMVKYLDDPLSKVKRPEYFAQSSAQYLRDPPKLVSPYGVLVE
jgi:hypothetical protein